MNSKKRRQKKHQNKKRKPKVTKEYLETESEISNLLQKTQIGSTVQKEKNEITSKNEIEFFTALNVKNEESAPQSLQSVEESIKKSSLQSDTHRELLGSVGNVPAPSSATVASHPVSSFIQIEDLSPIRKAPKQKIVYNRDDELYYYPPSDTSAINLQILQQSNSFGEDGVHHDSVVIEKDKNIMRMVNRFNEEGKFDLISPTSYIKNQQKFTNDNELYKTEDVEKIFTPFYYTVPVSDIQRELLSNKKLLTLTINELKFTEHVLHSDEHRLAIQLENTFTAYQELNEQNLIKKLKLELKSLRETFQYFLENSIQEENFEKLENYTKQIKFLRKKLHKEEFFFKNQIQNALNQWIALKNCRKMQGYNYTDFKLVIQIEEVDPEEDEHKWSQRYQIELNEILREKFEKYYKEKRLKKLKKGTDDIRKFPLKKPDANELSIEVENNLRTCIRCIGEPKIKLYRTKLDDRCKNLDKFKDYFLQIIFDKEFVGATKHFHLNSDFIIEINQSFGVYLESSIPKSIKIEIFEKSKLTTPERLCKCYIPLQLMLDYSSGYQEVIEFSSNRKNDKISGILKVTIFCETELNLNQNNANITNFISHSQSKSKISKEVLKSWYENNLINPLDPECISLFNNLSEKHIENQLSSKTEIDDDENFNLNEDLLAFCSKAEIDNNPRFNMLKARYYKDMKYKNFKFIPLYENEIEEIDSESKVLDEGNWMDAIDLQKYKGKKYIQKLYDTILNHCTQLKIDEDNSNLLIGDEPPTWRSILNSVKHIFGASRPLNPAKTVQSISQFSFRPENFNIVINIARATGIPVRNFNVPPTRRTSSISTETEKQTLRYGNIKPYVCVNYKDKIVRTMTAEGSNPTWNEQLILQINETKENLKEDIVIQIFDEYIEDLINEENNRSMELYQRIHTNWLGEYRIPIKTIFDRQNIEGCFEINLPKLIIGYCKPTIDINDNGDTIPHDNILEIRDSVYISLYINVEPKFDTQIVDKSPLECSELKEVKMQIEEWCIQIKELTPTRFLYPLICTETGKRICMTRLLECIPLPIDVQLENVENLIRHYVSLIPILKNETDCLGLQGVWLSNQTILDTTWASPKDLGVLLACYYMTLGIRCWLVLGITYPHGETAYVLTQEHSNLILTDSTTGKRYDSKDVQCPLSKIFYLVGQENIYCNLQKEERVSMTDFNLNDNSLWYPLFSKSNPAPIGGFHSLNYKYRHSNNIFELRKNMERKIMKKISSWRSTRTTIWNRAYTQIMGEILSNLEQDTILETTSDNYLEKLTREITNYKVFGFTLNFPYVNLTSISKQIRATGIHLNMDKNIEFALSVYIQHYPNNILSCWIFLITLTPFN